MKTELNEILALPIALLVVGCIWHLIIKPATESKVLRFFLGLILFAAGVFLLFAIRGM